MTTRATAVSGCLAGRRILVTRPAAQAAPLATAIAAEGGEARCFPLIDIAPATDPEPLAAFVAARATYALAVFVSPNAVEHSLPALLAVGPWPEGLTAIGVGPGTAARLADFGVVARVPAEHFDSEGMLELPELQPAAVVGRRVALVRGDGGRDLLASTLAERGAQVDAVACYRRLAPGRAEPLVSWLRNKAVDALTVSSSEGLRNLFALLDTENAARLTHLPCFVPHPRIAATAAELGLRRVVQTGAADAGILRALREYPWSKNE